MPKNFFICGLAGWCMEILFTSIKNVNPNDHRLIGHTSIWMFPIYGIACIIKPLFKTLHKIPILLRGCIYSAGILGFEYMTGTLLRQLNVCPWDYSDAPTNINGIIRLDYAPFWMGAGLLFEKILMKRK